MPGCRSFGPPPAALSLRPSHTRAGIRVHDSQNTTLTFNDVRDNGGQGIRIHGASGNIVENNLASGNRATGIRIATGSHSNQVRYNTCTFNHGGIYIVGHPDTDSLCHTTVTGNTASDNTESGILFFLCSDNLITGNTCERNEGTGIGVGRSANTTVSDNTLLDNGEGISVYIAPGITIRNNLASHGDRGILVHECENGTIADNTISSNTKLGIEIAGLVDSTLTGNLVSDNDTGIKLIGCHDNRIYNNTFVENTTQAVVTAGSTGNLFNLEKPTGGNFWSNWTGPDDDGDGFVDLPYVFAGGQDDLPWAAQDGWHSDVLIEQLLTQVAELNLPQGIENSLIATLTHAARSLDRGNTTAAINQLKAFINKVEAQRGKKIPAADADALIAAAQEIIALLNRL